MKYQNTTKRNFMTWLPAIFAAATLAFAVAAGCVQPAYAASFTTGTESKSVQTADEGATPMYRLYKPKTGEHLYTTDATEKKVLTASRGWKYEGIAWYAPKKSSTPVTRLYNPESGEHHYTADKVEIRVLHKQRGWRNEGIKFYSSDAKAILVNRLYSPTAKRIAQHHYTTDANEVRVLTKVRKNWKPEKSMIYCLKTSYKVAFKANGGTGTMATKTYDSLTKYTLPSVGFKKAGYTFAGWATSAKGKVVYQNKASVRAAAYPGKTLTLYAQWKKIPPYTIKFDVNVGSLDSYVTNGTMTNQSVDVNIATSLKDCTFKMTGYRFLGWNTKADGSGKSYGNKQSVYNIAKSGETVTLYALWSLKPPRDNIKVPAIKSKILNKVIGCALSYSSAGCTVYSWTPVPYFVEAPEANPFSSPANMWGWDRAAVQQLIDMGKAYVNESSMEVVWVDYDYWQRWNKGCRNNSAMILSWEAPNVCDACNAVVGYNPGVWDCTIHSNRRGDGMYGTAFEMLNVSKGIQTFKTHSHYSPGAYHELGTETYDYR